MISRVSMGFQYRSKGFQIRFWGSHGISWGFQGRPRMSQENFRDVSRGLGAVPQISKVVPEGPLQPQGTQGHSATFQRFKRLSVC